MGKPPEKTLHIEKRTGFRRIVKSRFDADFAPITIGIFSECGLENQR